jgi:hypothetical protein
MVLALAGAISSLPPNASVATTTALTMGEWREWDFSSRGDERRRRFAPEIIDVEYRPVRQRRRSASAGRYFSSPSPPSPCSYSHGGRSESHYEIARYFVDDLKRFQHFRGRDLNSHMQSLDGYRRMYSVFEPMHKSLANRLLSAAEIIAIVIARRSEEVDRPDPSATKH